MMRDEMGMRKCKERKYGWREWWINGRQQRAEEMQGCHDIQASMLK